MSTAFISGEASTSTVVAGLAHFQRRVHRGRAVGLHRDVRRLLHLETLAAVGQRVGADGQVDERIAARAVGLGGARQRSLLVSRGDRCVGNHAARGVSHLASDAAKRLLCA